MWKSFLVWTISISILTIFRINGEEYRLARTVLPQSYSILLKFDEKSFINNTFEGEVNITLQVVNETKNFQLHSKDLNIIQLRLTDLNENINVQNSINSVDDILRINCTEALSPGRSYRLFIVYKGLISLKDMHGIYKSSYIGETNHTEYLFATQFEVTHARRAFPCFDEPSFKATFNVSVIHPKEYNVIANTQPLMYRESNETTKVFATTPIMSTYLNAFIISKFTCSQTEFKNVVYKVCSTPQTENYRTYALDISPKIMQFLDDFTGIPYSIGKMDQVAIPDFSANAMENWGLVTYREAALLWDENESSNLLKQRVASIIAHEFAHMWFGNLVTLNWWSDVFLNEGFARYFQYLAVNDLELKWEMSNQFVIEQVHSALAEDSLDTSVALSSNVNTINKISNKFGTISYNKGASILRMIVNVIGMDNFKKAIQNYLKTHSFKNTVPDDLWDSFEDYYTTLPDNITLKAFIENWIQKPGYPVVNVKENGSNVVITQEPFLSSGRNNTTWYIPITYTDSNGNTLKWLTPNTKELEIKNVLFGENSWITINNNQAGFYRVNYDDKLRRRIHHGLRDHPNDIYTINKAQFVDDLFSFALNEKVSVEVVFDMISFLETNIEYYPWYSAFNGFSRLLEKLNNQTILSNYIKKLMVKLYNSVPFGEEKSDDQIYTLKQGMAIKWACKLGNADCVNNSTKLFSDYRKNNTLKLNKNLKGIIYCTALRHSNNTEQDWDYLWNKFTTTNIPSEKVTILEALACTSNKIILEKYLDKTINATSGIRMHDFSLVISSVARESSNGAEIVFKFLVEKYKHILPGIGKEKTENLLSSTVKLFTNETKIDEFLKFLNTTTNETLQEYAVEKLNLAKKNLNFTRKLEKSIEQYFTVKENLGVVPKAGAVLTVTFIVICYQIF